MAIQLNKKILFVLIALTFVLPSFASAATIGRPGNYVSLSSGLVGYWPFDGLQTNWATGQTQDLSGQGNTGQVISMSTTTSPIVGKMGQALNFNGSTSYVSTKASNSFGLTSAVTMSGWVKTTNSHDERVVDFYRIAGASGLILGLALNSSGTDANDGKPYGAYRNGTNGLGIAKSATAINDGKWHLVTWTVSGSNGVLYVDGVSAATVSDVNTANTFTFFTDPMSIGTFSNSTTGGALTGVFSGTIDDVRLYSRALSASEVGQLYNLGANVGHANAAVLTSGLLGYWPLDGATTNWVTEQTQDLSGQGHTGQFFSLSTTTSPAVGKIGQALFFNGTATAGNSHYVQVSSSPIVTGVNLTMAAWVKFTGATNNQGRAIYSERAASGNDIIKLNSLRNSNSIGIVIRNDAANLLQADGTAVINDGRWHFVAATKAGSAVNLYVDGSSTLSTTWPSADTFTDANRVSRIGGDAGDNTANFPGTIDDVRVYNRALSAAEILQLYSLGVPNVGQANVGTKAPLSSGLVGYWPFDGSQTNWATGKTNDLSGSGNNGNLISMSTTTSPTVGKIGQALSFNAGSQEVNVGNVSALQITGALTMAAWVKYGSAQANKGIMGKYDTATNNRAYALFTANDGTGAKLGCTAQTSGSAFDTNAQATTNTGYNDGKWHHVVCVYNPSTQLQIYVDGVSASANAVTVPASIFNSTASFEIGNYNQTSNNFSGSIDDARVYNRALSAAEIQQLYSMGR